MTKKMNRWPIYSFGVVCFGYLIWMVSHISVAYLDFGDGNYLYISRRLLQGVVIYKDILSPQPPFHLYLGALLLKLGDVAGNPLFLVRVFTILLRIVHGVLIYLIGRKLFVREESPDSYEWMPSFAGIIYLFLPIGFWWSRGYQSEPLEILWMLLAFLFFIRFEKKGMALAGIFASFAVFTNMTGAPYLVLSVLYLLLFRRELVLWYIVPAVVFLGVMVMVFQGLSSGMFLQNAILDQVGTYPKEHTLEYMFGKIKWVGSIILKLEGLLILGCVTGLVLYALDIFKGKPWYKNPQVYVVVYMLAILGSFVFATKGGTVDYIFTIGEPAVALFAAYGVVRLIPKNQTILYSVGILFLLSVPGFYQDKNTLQGFNYELYEEDVNAVVQEIHKYSGPHDLIFAPPYFAFLADRPIVGEFSEQYVWFIKYINWMMYGEGNPQTLPKLEKIGEQMADKKVKIILLNVERGRGQQTGQIEPFRKAVSENYHAIGKIPMRNETLTIFIPNN